MNTFYMKDTEMKKGCSYESVFLNSVFSENKVAVHRHQGDSGEDPTRWFITPARWFILDSWHPSHSSIFLEILALLKHNKLVTVIE